MNCMVCAATIDSVFYTTVNVNGLVETYCNVCYKLAVLDNYPGMVDGGGTFITPVKCECGKDKHGFANHSRWCPKN